MTVESENRIQAFVQYILQECEKEGLSIREVESLPQSLKFAISDSIIKQTKDLKFKL